MIQRRVGLGLVAGRAPGGDAVAAEDARRPPAGWRRWTAAMSRPSWKPGRRHGHPHDLVAEDRPW